MIPIGCSEYSRKQAPEPYPQAEIQKKIRTGFAVSFRKRQYFFIAITSGRKTPLRLDIISKYDIIRIYYFSGDIRMHEGRYDFFTEEDREQFKKQFPTGLPLFFCMREPFSQTAFSGRLIPPIRRYVPSPAPPLFSFRNASLRIISAFAWKRVTA